MSLVDQVKIGNISPETGEENDEESSEDGRKRVILPDGYERISPVQAVPVPPHYYLYRRLKIAALILLVAAAFVGYFYYETIRTRMGF